MWGGDPGRYLIAVKGSLQFFCFRVTFRSVNTLPLPYKMFPPADARVSGDFELVSLGFFFHLFVSVMPWHSLNTADVRTCRKRLQKQLAGTRGAQTEASTPLLCLPPPTYPGEGRWMDDESAISGDIILEKRNEWGEIRGVG